MTLSMRTSLFVTSALVAFVVQAATLIFSTGTSHAKAAEPADIVPNKAGSPVKEQKQPNVETQHVEQQGSEQPHSEQPHSEQPRTESKQHIDLNQPIEWQKWSGDIF